MDAGRLAEAESRTRQAVGVGLGTTRAGAPSVTSLPGDNHIVTSWRASVRRPVPAVAVAASTASETNVAIVDAWRALGVDAAVVAPSDCLGAVEPGGVAIGRIDVRRSLDGVEPGLIELHELRHQGIRVLNSPSALLRAHDKLRTAWYLAASNVPHPRTEHISARYPVPSLRPPVVVKPRFGSWGADVLRCDSAAAVRRATDAIAERVWFQRQGAIVQSLVPMVGTDLRVLVAGGRVVGAECRIAAPGEWRTNISLGGTRHPAIVTPRARAVALAAARAVGSDFVGVDLVPHDHGYVVIEVNASVDFQMRYSLPGTNVFTEIAVALDLVAPGALSSARVASTPAS